MGRNLDSAIAAQVDASLNLTLATLYNPHVLIYRGGSADLVLMARCRFQRGSRSFLH
jgi:hypothetical protein